MNPVAPIYVGQLQNGVIWIRVEGKGSFKNSSELKEFASIVINKGAKEFVIDLENCPVMDSTFMGTLVGITRNLSTIDQSRIDVINANSRNEQLLVSLGIDKILSLDENNKVHHDIRDDISEHIENGHYLEHEELDLSLIHI